MPEPARLTGGKNCIGVVVVQRAATPGGLIKLEIQPHAYGLSLSNTSRALECFGVGRVRSTIHNWVQKAERQPAAGTNPAHVAVDETVIQVHDQRYWLSTAVDPSTSEFLHVSLFPSRTTALTKLFLRELREKHDIEDSCFLIAGAPWPEAALFETGLRFQHEPHGNQNSVERVVEELGRGTEQFANHFRTDSAESAETWLQTFAFAWNQLI